MNDLVKILPRPDGKSKVIKRFQKVSDIVELLLIADLQNSVYKNILSSYFSTGNKLKDIRAAYNYALANIQYLKEGTLQTAKTIPAILNFGFGDCKHFSLFLASCCRALSIPYKFRFTSYNKYDSEATHVYIVANVYGKELILDGVLKVFGAEKPYQYKYDYKPL
jgi:hypothetical protein